MSLRLYFHPLASFCWKALIALYENDTPFEPHLVDLGDPSSRADFAKIWPLAKFPVLRDEARNQTVAEATIVIEYLDAFCPGRTRFIPADGDAGWQTRMWDRFFDLYIHEQMQKLVADHMRPEGKKDPQGVEQATTLIRQAYGIIEREIGSRAWAMGENFSLVDCAAAPALSYATIIVPFDSTHRVLPAYLDRLRERPAFARVLEEAEPYFKFFPFDEKPRLASGRATQFKS